MAGDKAKAKVTKKATEPVVPEEKTGKTHKHYYRKNGICACGVVKKTKTRAKPKVKPVVPAGETVGSLAPGVQFPYKGQTYTRHGETEEAVVAEGLDGEIIRIPKDTLV